MSARTKHRENVTLLRSALFTPADKLDRFAKGYASGADAVVVDLEDGVGLSAKQAARNALLELVPKLPESCFWILRINHVKTREGLLDLLAIETMGIKPPVIMLPKTESTAEIEIAVAHLSDRTGTPTIIALVESAEGLSQAENLARHPAVGALAFGGADLASDLDAELAWEPMLFARSRLVQASALGGAAAWDVPYLKIADLEGLRREAASARALGFRGKLAIHPGQIAIINSVFTPDADQLAFARRVVAASEQAGGGVVVVDANMVDRPILKAAQRAISRAEPRRSSRQEAQIPDDRGPLP
ncbi:(S)-citramalyl-CoA lyase [Rhizobiales bacterium GAS188]|nr:(S)-citramalyl-CoA lyase [Rhizobiales bacterium GAS188]